jgi:biopolymer transport protein ExbB
MEKITLLQYFFLGGIFMWPLLFFSIATAAIVIERGIYIFIMHNLKVDDIEKDILEKIRGKNIEGAKKFCAGFKDNKLGAQIIHEGLKMTELGEHRIEKALESETAEKVKSLEKGFNFLTALASVSPLTGFLGTVSGMIGAFRAIASASEVNAQIVANGIYEALITTVYGLVIAIFALTFYNIYAHVIDKFVGDVEKAGSDIVNEIILSGGNKKKR